MKYSLIEDMFPQYLAFKSSEILKDQIVINFDSQQKHMKCPRCGRESNQITTYFNRTLQDLPIIDRTLFLKIRLKKFRCLNHDCEQKIFNETINEVAFSGERRTKRLNDMLVKFALLHTAEGASRFLKQNHILISGDTLLRMTMNWEPEIDYIKIEVIGIDDFCTKKKNYYGTIIIDLGTNKEVEILNSRDTQNANKALMKYTNLKIISRDRGVQYQSINGNYTHVADRSHLLTNLSDWLIREMKRQLPSQYILRNYESAFNGSPDKNSPDIIVNSDATKRKFEIIEKARLLSRQGYSQRHIAEVLSMDR